jgi:pyridoxamine 5'-phosphate oxidase
MTLGVGPRVACIPIVAAVVFFHIAFRRSVNLVLSMRVLSPFSASYFGINTSTGSTFCSISARQQYRRSLKDQQRNMGTPMDDVSTTKHGFQDIAAVTTTSNHSQGQSFSPQLTPWREAIEVSIAKSRKIRGGNYVQLSTIDAETNEPRCRTVVFRGFQPLGPHTSSTATARKPFVMKMITDSRSRKVKELTSSSIAEMVWWFSQSSEQYRIRGRIQFVGENTEDDYLRQARKEQWGNLSDSAREQFYWTTPGILHEEHKSIEIPKGGRDAFSGRVLPPPKEFLLMLLHPFHVDYLRLSDNYRQIDDLDNDNEMWYAKRVTP